MDELELRHAAAHYAEMPRDGYSGRCEMLLPEDLRGMRVLDLGCRNGKGACKLADRVGPDGFVLGVDPSAACVARAEATAAAAWDRTPTTCVPTGTTSSNGASPTTPAFPP